MVPSVVSYYVCIARNLGTCNAHIRLIFESAQTLEPAQFGDAYFDRELTLSAFADLVRRTTGECGTGHLSEDGTAGTNGEGGQGSSQLVSCLWADTASIIQPFCVVIDSTFSPFTKIVDLTQVMMRVHSLWVLCRVIPLYQEGTSVI